MFAPALVSTTLGGEPPRASIWGFVFACFCFLMQGISRLTLEMTSCSLGLRADEERPYHALPKVSTGIADLPSAARRRADEERPYHALPKVSTGVADLPSGAPRRADEERPYHALPKVSTGIADLPSGAPRRADEERPYHALTKLTKSSGLLKPSPRGEGGLPKRQRRQNG